MARHRFIVAALLLIMMTALLVACEADEDDPEPTDAPVPTATPVITEEPQATEETTATEEAVTTPDVEDQPPSATDGGEFYMFVRRTLTENFAEGLGDPPAGTRWIEVEATLGHDSDATVTVTAEHLALVDDEGNRYPVEDTEEFLNPPLVNAEIETGNSILGYARFAIPEDVMPTAMTWCYDGTCDDTIQSPVELPE